MALNPSANICFIICVFWAFRKFCFSIGKGGNTQVGKMKSCCQWTQ